MIFFLTLVGAILTAELIRIGLVSCFYIYRRNQLYKQADQLDENLKSLFEQFKDYQGEDYDDDSDNTGNKLH